MMFWKWIFRCSAPLVVSRVWAFYKDFAALPLLVYPRRKMQVQSTDNICSQDAPPEGNAGAEHRNIKTGNCVFQ